MTRNRYFLARLKSPFALVDNTQKDFLIAIQFSRLHLVEMRNS